MGGQRGAGRGKIVLIIGVAVWIAQKSCDPRALLPVLPEHGQRKKGTKGKKMKIT